jgi:hypothetical protein
MASRPKAWLMHNGFIVEALPERGRTGTTGSRLADGFGLWALLARRGSFFCTPVF